MTLFGCNATRRTARASVVFWCLTVALLLVPAGSAVAAGWRIVPSPAAGALNSVSCTSPSACTAVGFEGTGAGGGGTILTERWNGSAWSVQPNTPPSGGQSEWDAVSCGSLRFCVALGLVVYSPSFTGRFRSIRGMWNGSKWSVQVLPNNTTVGGVYCASRLFCVMTGHPAERWDGSRWSKMPTPDHRAQLAGPVTCISAESCLMIAGTTAERWNGEGWSMAGRLQVDVGPYGVYDSSGVACASLHLCVAIGWTQNGGDGPQTPDVEQWNGNKWFSKPALAQPLTNLASVSCSPVLSCTIVGAAVPNDAGLLSPSGTLAERWSGTRWARQPTPNPPGTSAGSRSPTTLDGVSCVARTCVGVGSALVTPFQAETLIEQYL